ncbi:UDP-glucose 4-epimerase GalE [Microbulbifer sp. 2205BS26-8]|uniref:UDP-glucose 4-epimerase GalE n=1 Tax=Microbulbifer sp. 2205BS26-8 TaxID=3064386 RepID=UPI00273D9E83|nr:UDP-glucose 4-epimerase GalE [Microbulbifer sp. 2205BS26-8]MDP5209205.1 UDP-glucose 4-epimerase GalE [Microbulbifer sp. 2205BS26-8]
MSSQVLVTGGVGYIGTHTLVALQEVGYDVIVVDNLCNSSAVALQRVETISGKPVCFYRGDILDRALLNRVFAENQIFAVIHFAGLKAVSESLRKPIEYYQNNIIGSLVLLDAMRASGVKRFVFSSSATVYGSEAPVPYVETLQTGNTTNPYGTSKWMVEQVLQDTAAADSEFAIALLRYFNPVGAHPSGLIGEDPQGIPNNLLPYIAQVAVGKREELSVFGDDYPTPDGTCLRDYVHVVDLAQGHVRALEWLVGRTGAEAFNLGAGRGISVLEIVRAFEHATGVSVPFRVVSRREGDLPAFWADTFKAKQELGWVANLGLEEMMVDTWRWQNANPQGYQAVDTGK